MNPKIKKLAAEIEKTRAKIAELQALLPELEQQKTEMENNEVIRLMRLSSVKPEDLAAFIAESKAGNRAKSSEAAEPLLTQEEEVRDIDPERE